MSYALNFVIPQGPTGPIGPMGPKGENGTTGLNAYGGKYSPSNTKINLGISTPAQVPLSNNMPEYNINYSANNGIVIQQTGIYEISYYLSFTVSYDTELQLNIRKNSSNLPFLAMSKSLTAGNNYVFNGSFITELSSSDVITMVLVSTISTTVNLDPNNGASLIIKKIN